MFNSAKNTKNFRNSFESSASHTRDEKEPTSLQNVAIFSNKEMRITYIIKQFISPNALR